MFSKRFFAQLEFLEYSIFISLFVPGPKVFATEADYHEFDGYSEEVLALAIVMTAFVALVIGKNETLFQLWNFLHEKLSCDLFVTSKNETTN